VDEDALPEGADTGGGGGYADVPVSGDAGGGVPVEGLSVEDAADLVAAGDAAAAEEEETYGGVETYGAGTLSREQLIAQILDQMRQDPNFSHLFGGPGTIEFGGPGDLSGYAETADINQMIEDWIAYNVTVISEEDMQAYVDANLISEERIQELVDEGTISQDQMDIWIAAAVEAATSEFMTREEFEQALLDGTLTPEQIQTLIESEGFLTEDDVLTLLTDGMLTDDQIQQLIDSGQFTEQQFNDWLADADVLTYDEIMELIGEGLISEDQIKQWIADGVLTDEHIQELIATGQFTEDQITTWINEASAEFQTYDEIMELIRNYALSSTEIQSLLDQGLLTDDHIRALIQSEQLTPDEIRALVASGRLDPDTIREIVAEMTGGMASGDLADYVTLLGLEERLGGYSTPESVGTQISEAFGGVDIAALQAQYEAMQEHLNTLQEQYDNAQTQYEADAAEQQIQQTEQELDTFFENASAPRVTSGSTSRFGPEDQSPMGSLAASQQGIWAPFVGNEPVTFQNMAYGQSTMDPYFRDYSQPIAPGTWGSTPVGSTSNLEYPSPFFLPQPTSDQVIEEGEGGYQGGIVSTPQASALLNGKMGVDQTPQTGIMNPLAFQTNVAPFQNAFRPNRPR
jgi:bacterioferritin-associated ferredoxin